MLMLILILMLLILIESTEREASSFPYRQIRTRRSRTSGTRCDLSGLCARAYFAASCFTFVWKMASHFPFSDFQTVPALKTPEASLPSTVPLTATT